MNNPAIHGTECHPGKTGLHVHWEQEGGAIISVFSVTHAVWYLNRAPKPIEEAVRMEIMKTTEGLPATSAYDNEQILYVPEAMEAESAHSYLGKMQVALGLARAVLGKLEQPSTFRLYKSHDDDEVLGLLTDKHGREFVLLDAPSGITQLEKLVEQGGYIKANQFEARRAEIEAAAPHFLKFEGDRKQHFMSYRSVTDDSSFGLFFLSDGKHLPLGVHDRNGANAALRKLVTESHELDIDVYAPTAAIIYSEKCFLPLEVKPSAKEVDLGEHVATVESKAGHLVGVIFHAKDCPDRTQTAAAPPAK